MTTANMRLASRVHNRWNRNLSNRCLNRAKNVMFDTMDIWTIGGYNIITEDRIHVQGLDFRMCRQHAEPEPNTRCMAVNELVVNLWIKLSVVISHQGATTKNCTSSTYSFYTEGFIVPHVFLQDSCPIPGLSIG